MKRRWVFVLLSLSMLLISCKKKDDQQTAETITVEASSANEGEKFVTQWGSDDFYTEDFALYHTDHGRLQIFDVASKSDRVFCFDPGCEHDKHRKVEVSPDGIETVVEEGCMARNISSYTVMVQGDHLCFVKYTGDVIQSDLQGKNRKVIATIPPYSPVQRIIYYKDAIFGDYSTSYEILEIEGENGEPDWIYGEMKEKDTVGIARANLNDGMSSEIFKREDYSAGLYYLTVRGTHLYFAYTYSEMQYMAPDGQMWRPMQEEWKDLSVEEYLEEREKRSWMEIYDYDIDSGEVRCVMNGLRQGRVVFCNGFFAVQPGLPGDGNKTILYRYTGEAFRELEGFILSQVYCDRHLVGLCDGEYQMIDEDTGEVLKRVRNPDNPCFYPKVFIGKSCYGGVVGEDWISTSAYISSEDFWNGKFENVILMNDKEK
ncbi:MAG: hypothetical protein IKS10_10290 [Lachnospiraceae bacterium]|nr:hypothetical protein [Lachnospiraceae bacterium]